MYFDIADRFFGGKPLDSAYPVIVRVVYFDSGSGSWALTYDANGGKGEDRDRRVNTEHRTLEGSDRETGRRLPGQPLPARRRPGI